MEPIIHPSTKSQLEILANDPPQGLLLAGPSGVGKGFIAKWWGLRLTGRHSIIVVEPDEKGLISIESIRGLYRQTRAASTELQVIIIHQAQSLSLEAQNAFLKLLEEPRSGVVFVLTAPEPSVLLPTIVSRLQQASVLPVGQNDLRAAIPSGYTPEEIAQLQFMAQGRPAVLAQLLDNPELFARRRELMQRAKTLLGTSAYHRLSALGGLAKDKKEAIFILEAMAYMLKLRLQKKSSAKELALAEDLNECLARLAAGGNPRAQMARLFTAVYQRDLV